MSNFKPMLVYIAIGLIVLAVPLFLLDGASWAGFSGDSYGIQFSGFPWFAFGAGVVYVVFGAEILGKLKLRL